MTTTQVIKKAVKIGKKQFGIDYKFSSMYGNLIAHMDGTIRHDYCLTIFLQDNTSITTQYCKSVETAFETLYVKIKEFKIKVTQGVTI